MNELTWYSVNSGPHVLDIEISQEPKLFLIEYTIFAPKCKTMQIYEYYNKCLNINLQSNADLPFHVFEKKMKKGAILTDYGQVERHAYFLQSGIVQLTILGDDGFEKIIDFIETGAFVCSYSSFLTQQPSDVQLIALSDCVMDAFTYDDLQNAYRTSLIANQMGRLATEMYYIIKTNREKDFLLKSAEERYLELVSQKPQAIAVLPVNKIAKYLGIHPESLSRIRKKIIS